ncbi:hypothetical protein GA0070615_5329 [Micromonospora aurantiaca]|nr:hypothetical protein GA0070615_5329 [Micromonospora aurantiaca]
MCARCDAPLPATRRADRRFCSDRCRTAHFRAEHSRRLAELTDEVARLRAAREVTE